MIRWPGKVPAGKVENGIISGLDWFPTFVAAAGNPNIVDELKKGEDLGGQNYKVHLDGYNQMDMITGKGPSNRHEIFYCGESTVGAVRVDDFKYRFIDLSLPKTPVPSCWRGTCLRERSRRTIAARRADGRRRWVGTRSEHRGPGSLPR